MKNPRAEEILMSNYQYLIEKKKELKNHGASEDEIVKIDEVISSIKDEMIRAQ